MADDTTKRRLRIYPGRESLRRVLQRSKQMRAEGNELGELDKVRPRARGECFLWRLRCVACHGKDELRADCHVCRGTGLAYVRLSATGDWETYNLARYQAWLDASDRSGLLPCLFVGCKHHLYLDPLKTGSIKFNFPSREVWEMSGDSCSLDVADRGGVPLRQIGPRLGITKQAILNIFRKIYRKDFSILGQKSLVNLRESSRDSTKEDCPMRRDTPEYPIDDEMKDDFLGECAKKPGGHTKASAYAWLKARGFTRVQAESIVEDLVEEGAIQILETNAGANVIEKIKVVGATHDVPAPALAPPPPPPDPAPPPAQAAPVEAEIPHVEEEPQRAEDASMDASLSEEERRFFHETLPTLSLEAILDLLSDLTESLQKIDQIDSAQIAKAERNQSFLQNLFMERDRLLLSFYRPPSRVEPSDGRSVRLDEVYRVATIEEIPTATIESLGSICSKIQDARREEASIEAAANSNQVERDRLLYRRRRLFQRFRALLPSRKELMASVALSKPEDAPPAGRTVAVPDNKLKERVAEEASLPSADRHAASPVSPTPAPAKAPTTAPAKKSAPKQAKEEAPPAKPVLPSFSGPPGYGQIKSRVVLVLQALSEPIRAKDLAFHVQAKESATRAALASLVKDGLAETKHDAEGVLCYVGVEEEGT